METTVPVLDLRERLALPPLSTAVVPTDPADAALLLVHSRGRLLIVPVDRVEGVLHIEATLETGTGWDCARGLVQVNGRLITVFDADALPIAALTPLLSGQHS